MGQSNRKHAGDRARQRGVMAAWILGLWLGGVVGADTAFAQARQEPVTWKLHGDQAMGFWWSDELTKFTRLVEQATNGAVKLQYYPSSSLGVQAQSILAPVRAGSIEIAEFVASYVASEAPYLTVLGLPMIATSVEQGRRITDAVRGEIEKEMAAQYELRVLATLTSTPLQLYMGKHQYRGIDSLKDLRIRTLGPDQEFFVRGLGATPVTVPIAEMVSSLATNRVDAVIAGTQYMVTQKFSQYGPNILSWNAILGPGFLVVGQRKWDSLSKETQQGVLKAAKEFEDGVWTRAAVLEKDMQAQAEKDGFKIVALSDADRGALTAKARDAWANWARRSGPLAKKLLDTASAVK